MRCRRLSRRPALNSAADMTRREITARTVVLSLALAVLLAAANAYLGLKVGMTVSASIPAAVVAMGALRLFRGRSTLESNIVQTAASAGEALAAGVIFTLPALVLLGHWSDFHYTETAVIAGLGGVRCAPETGAVGSWGAHISGGRGHRASAQGG